MISLHLVKENKLNLNNVKARNNKNVFLKYCVE